MSARTDTLIGFIADDDAAARQLVGRATEYVLQNVLDEDTVADAKRIAMSHAHDVVDLVGSNIEPLARSTARTLRSRRNLLILGALLGLAGIAGWRLRKKAAIAAVSETEA